MSDFNSRLARAKKKWPLDALMRHLGYGEEYLKPSCKSPFREDKKASWGVFRTQKGELKFKDQSTDEGGDQVDFIAQHFQCSTKDALDFFFELAGEKAESIPTKPKRITKPAPIQEEKEKLVPVLNAFDWDACVAALDEEKIAGFAKWRGYTPEFVTWLKEQRMVGMYQDCPATPVIKNGVVVGCQYRTTDGPRYANATPGEKTPAEPLVIGSPMAPALLVMESQWDAFAIMEAGRFHLPGGINAMLGLAVTRSASNSGKLIELFRERAKSEVPGDIILVGQNDPTRLDEKPTGHEVLEAGIRKLCAETGLTPKVALPPKGIKDVNDWWAPARTGAAHARPDPCELIELIENAKAFTKSKLTVRGVRELINYRPKKAEDNYFGDRIIAMGQPSTFLGPGGVGKSRLITQLAVCMILGKPFLGIETHGKQRKWLVIQTENNNRRLQSDLKGIIYGMGIKDQETETLDECLIIHTIEHEHDAFMSLVDDADFKEVQGLITDLNPAFVVFDPLNTFTTGDLNSDSDMRELCSSITRAVKRGNPDRVPLVLHHSRTGKQAAASALGWDAASYGRNSKVLQAWTRSQVNIVPRDPEDNTKLMITCGKNNNGAPFPPMGVLFDQTNGIYKIDPDFDIDKFKEETSERKGYQKKIRGRPPVAFTPEQVAALCEPSMIQWKLRDAIKSACGAGDTRCYELIHEARNMGLLLEDRKGKSTAYSPVIRNSPK